MFNWLWAADPLDKQLGEPELFLGDVCSWWSCAPELIPGVFVWNGCSGAPPAASTANENKAAKQQLWGAGFSWCPQAPCPIPAGCESHFCSPRGASQVQFAALWGEPSLGPGCLLGGKRCGVQGWRKDGWGRQGAVWVSREKEWAWSNRPGREKQEDWRGLERDWRQAGEPSQASKAHWISLDFPGITLNPPNVVAVLWGALNLPANNKLFPKHHRVIPKCNGAVLFLPLFSTFLQCRGRATFV